MTSADKIFPVTISINKHLNMWIMKKTLFFAVLLLGFFSTTAHAATVDRSNGFCLAQDGQNLYFSSPESMSFVVMDKTTGILSFYKQPGSSDAGLNLGNAAVSLGETVLFSNSFGVHSYSKEGESITSLSQMSVYTMAVSPEGSIWGGTADHHVGMITSEGTFDAPLYIGHEDKYANSGNMHITDMQFGSDGTLWIVSVSDDRTTLYRVKDGSVELLPAPEGIPTGAQAVEIDGDGNVWYATAHALVKYDGRDFTCYEVPSGMMPQGAKGIIQDFKFDDLGRIWILPLHGSIICAEDIEKGEYSYYEYEEVDAGSSTLDGMMYLAVDGATVYAVGGRLTEKTPYGISHQRALLVTVKDGRAVCHEITENMAGSSPLGIGSVETSGENTSSTLFDLQGRRLTQAPAKGVFIQNGKKVIY